MPDNECPPADYGTCLVCDGKVTLVLDENGERHSEGAAKRIPKDGWWCEKCMEKEHGDRHDWQPDEVTKSVLASHHVLPVLENPGN